MSASRRAINVATMDQTTISHTNATERSLPLRRVDGIELPAAGTWTVPGNHATLAFWTPRRLRQHDSSSGRASEATLIISEDPGDVVVAVLFEASDLEIGRSPAGTSGSPIQLLARSVPGPHRWALAGKVSSERGVLPLRGNLGYHGVWRRGDLTYGWFVLTGAMGAPHRRTRPLLFRFELLAAAPEAGSRRPPARSHAGSVGATWQRAGAA